MVYKILYFLTGGLIYILNVHFFPNNPFIIALLYNLINGENSQVTWKTLFLDSSIDKLLIVIVLKFELTLWI